MQIKVTYNRLHKICCTKYRRLIKTGDRVIYFVRKSSSGGSILTDSIPMIVIRISDTYDEGKIYLQKIGDTDHTKTIWVDPDRRLIHSRYLGMYVIKIEDLTDNERVMAVTNRLSK